MREAMFWERLDGETVRCTLCFRRCRIKVGDRGFCRVRWNRSGVLVSMVDAIVSSLNVDPVEKKPLYHFLPGSETLSLGTWGCNFDCRFCQNWHISRNVPETGHFEKASVFSAEETVAFARRWNIPSVSCTYNEPTVFWELVTELTERVIQAGLKTVLVTNGAMSPEALKSLEGRITAANVDLKSFSGSFYEKICRGSLRQVQENLVRMREMGIWLEVTTLIIPGLNDSEEETRAIARFVRDELGPDTPWHVSAFHPEYNMRDRRSTPSEDIIRVCEAGLEEGLRFVYSGNIRDERCSDTRCPACGGLCVRRRGYSVEQPFDGRCPGCGKLLPGVWQA